MAIAHRGASAYAPENTVLAFAEALRLGAPAVELDVRLTADGVPVVLHDETLIRTTAGHGPVSQMNWSDLRDLDAGTWRHPRFAGARIPSLDEALAVIVPRAVPVIELKTPLDPQLLEYLLKRHGAETTAVVISFEAAWLTSMRARMRDLRIGLLADVWSDDLPDRAAALEAEVLALSVDLLNLPRIAQVEARGLALWCFTANDVGLVAACAAMGVTGIITDRPDLIRHK